MMNIIFIIFLIAFTDYWGILVIIFGIYDLIMMEKFLNCIAYFDGYNDCLDSVENILEIRNE